MSDWILTVAGEIVRVDRENVDKSGRNPRYFYTFVVRPRTVKGVPAGAHIPEDVPIRIKDQELAGLNKGDDLEVGDAVEMTARANGPRPTSFYLTSVRRP